MRKIQILSRVTRLFYIQVLILAQITLLNTKASKKYL